MKPAAARALRFGLVGVVGFVVDATVLALLIGMIGPYWGRAVSFLCAVVATWVLNRRFTFRDRRSGYGLLPEFARYFAVMLGGGALNSVVYALLLQVTGHDGAWPYVAVAAGSLSGMALNLFLARFAVFRHAVDRD